MFIVYSKCIYNSQTVDYEALFVPLVLMAGGCDRGAFSYIFRFSNNFHFSFTDN